MRGDQLARVIRAIKTNLDRLTVTEIAQQEETGIRTILRQQEALQAAGFSLSAEKTEKADRRAFIDTFKFKILPPFTLTELMSLKEMTSGNSILEIKGRNPMCQGSC